MKKLSLAVVLAARAVVFAAPAKCSFDVWEGNPISWTEDSTKDAFTVLGVLDNKLSYRCGRMERVSVSARLTPEAGGTNGWSTMGLMVLDDDMNFWHVAFVQAPPDGQGRPGRRFFELSEMRDGNWLAQSTDGLRRTEARDGGVWTYGKAYDMTLSVDPSGVRGEVRDVSGAVLFVSRYAFPAPGADGKVKAVKCGRPGLHANGGFRGFFAKIDVGFSDPVPERAADPSAAISPYASNCFVPGVVGKATGFFHVEQKGDGRWWTIDPLGRGMVLFGVDHVRYGGHWSQRTGRSVHFEANKKKFPDKADWEDDTLARLKAWGFNMLGGGCDTKLWRRGLVHTLHLGMGNGLCREGMPAECYICPNEHRPCSAFPNVFHPKFAAWCDYVARVKCGPNKDDPWMFGYFIDNELAWWGRGARDTGLFDAVAKLPDGHSAKKAQKEFLAANGVAGAVSPDVKLAFLRLAADRYFRITSEAIRRHDPNHLVLGARFAGVNGAHPAVWETSGKYCDVVTFNCYPWADLDRNVVMMHKNPQSGRVSDVFMEQYRIVKRPMLITEWSFPALDSGLPCTGGAGQRFKTQALRTQASELFAKTMLSLPFFLGYDYFMWVDEPAEGISDAFPEDSNYGLINLQGEAYPEITSMFARLHREAGAWRKAPLPAEWPVLPDNTGVASERARAVLRCGTGARCVRDGDRYIVSNDAGLVLKGRVGGMDIFDEVSVGGVAVGRFTGMICNDLRGSSYWHNLRKITAVEWKDGVLHVAGKLDAGGTELSLSYAIVPVQGRPWFLCDLVKASNKGKVPVALKSFYFRQYAPYANDKDGDSGLKSVPNLWKAPSADVWFRKADGAYYGGTTRASTASMFMYFTSDGGKTQHPDAMFVPETTLVLAPGGTYEPRGTMWFLSVAGENGGRDAWLKTLNDVESLPW